MDEKETQSQGICQKLYNFIMKILALQAMKAATTPYDKGSSNQPATDIGAEHGFEKTNTSENSDSSTSLGSPPQNDQVKNNTEIPPAQPKAPKKMVSINDTVEEIHEVMKKRKKSKSFDRSDSLGSGEDEPKPLRSILKVGSNRDHESTPAFVNQSGS